MRSATSAFYHAIGEQVLTCSELQTVSYEVGNLLNERPIGRHPTDPDDGAYLCPNDLLLGRASNHASGGPFKEPVSLKNRFDLVQSITTAFWRKMIRDFFPSLMVQGKWHTKFRNVKTGDIVLIQDSDAFRGEWRMGKVVKAIESGDGVVRNCEVQCRLKGEGRESKKRAQKVLRPVQRLVVIVPVDE